MNLITKDTKINDFIVHKNGEKIAEFQFAFNSVVEKPKKTVEELEIWKTTQRNLLDLFWKKVFEFENVDSLEKLDEKNIYALSIVD